MIALSLIKNKKLKIIEKKIPNFLHPFKYRLQILYSGICASDIPRAFDNMAYNYPLVMGHEFVGKIIDIGRSVNKFNRNDIVSAYPLIPFCINKIKKNRCEQCQNGNYNLCKNYSYYGSREDGSFSEILDVYEWNLYKVDKKINHKLAALIEPTAVAFNIFNKFEKFISRKEKILLIGSGFIGQILARILNKTNPKVSLIALDRNLFKLREIKKYSDDQILFKNKNTNQDNYVLSSLKDKFDVVIECSGNHKNFASSLNFVKKNGLVVFSGNPNNDVKFSKDEISNILRKETIIKGVWNSTFKKKMNNWKYAGDFIKSTKNNDLEGLITHATTLEKSSLLLNKINLSKNKKIKLNYIKGIIKSS